LGLDIGGVIMSRLYAKVESPKDISRINCIIRDEMLVVDSPETLLELKKRSDYLCTLTFSPFWKKKFGPMIETLREVALEENRITTRLANYIAKYKNWDKEFKPWGEGKLKNEEEIKKELEELPEEVIKEVQETVTSLEFSPEILEKLREIFCDIRKAMVLVKDLKELQRLKRQSDLLVAITHLPDFKERFEELYDEIEKIVKKEEERVIKLANIIAEVNKWKAHFEPWSEAEVEGSLEEYIQKLLEEEEKASKYIPTEAKYKYGAVTIWLVYKHPKKKRYYAKRVYLPLTAKDIVLEGPGIFKNRFGKEVYGVKLEYKIRLSPTKIKVRGKEIELPERWVKRYKVVPLPEGVKEVEIKDERPEFAYPVS